MYKKFQQVEKILNKYLIERDQEIHGITLGILAGANVLFLGRPGIAKSLLVNYYSRLISGAKYFSWMLNQFSTPEELAGPFSLRGLEDDQYIRATAAMLPEADFAFIDEVYKGNTGVANFLLTIMNERIFYNNGIPEKVPLLSLVGASNELPEEGDDLDAMLDRFVIKFSTQPIAESSNFIKMLTLPNFEESPILTLDEMRVAQEETKKVIMTDADKKLLTDLRTLIGADGTYVSDRTYMVARNILKAEAYFNGRSKVNEEDFDILQHCLWSDPDHRKTIYSHILTKINPDKNKIDELFDDATDIYKEFMDLDPKEASLTTKAVEIVNKLKGAKSKLHEYEVNLKSRKKDVKSLIGLQTKIEDYLSDIFAAVGLNFKDKK